MAIFVLLFYALYATGKADDESGSVKNVTSRGPVNVEFGPLWLPRSFKITCCRAGQPVPENPQWIRNWTQTVLDYAIDEHYSEHGASGAGAVSMGETQPDNSCRLFQGDYLLSANALFNFNGLQGIGVTCHCPENSRTNHLDRNCRRLAPCRNNGYRSFAMSVICTCPEPYFGEFCDKYCDQGQRMKGADGRDYCGCVPFYQGEECREMVCLNGGTHIKQRCLCPPNYLGYHCEIDTNRTSGVSRFQRYGDQELMQGNELFTRDISGTIFSLIMIIVLVVSMYLLMKHRMQVQNRLATLRRDELARPSHGLGARRADLMSLEDARILPFRAAPIIDGGPPPYVPQISRGRIRRHEHLPPLPSYEDATKLPPLTRPTTVTIQEVQEAEEEEEEQQEHSENSFPMTSSPPTQRRDSERDCERLQVPEPSTSAPSSGGLEGNSSIFVVDRPKMDRNTATRKSI